MIQRLQLGLGLLAARRPAEASVDLKMYAAPRIERAAVGHDVRQHHRGHEEIDRPANLQPVEAFLGDADDRERVAPDAHVRPTMSGAHAEALDPEPVAEHDDGMAAPRSDRLRPTTAGPSAACTPSTSK